ncbi:MAG: thioesterase family protein [Alphaproteobacteria bacterium]
MPQQAPFRSSIMTIEPEWIDYNGHLNMAYYNILFDRSIDEAFHRLGLGPDYLAQANASIFTAQAHVSYLRELSQGDPVYVTLHLVDVDAKRTHVFQHLHHASQNFLSATCEQLHLHVDMATRRVSPFPEHILARLHAMKEAHSALPRDQRLGRTIAIPK